MGVGEILEQSTNHFSPVLILFSLVFRQVSIQWLGFANDCSRPIAVIHPGTAFGQKLTIR
jgi:hypothetical protein